MRDKVLLVYKSRHSYFVTDDVIYRKIQEKKPGAYIFQRPFFEELIFGGAYIQRGLSIEGNLRFKIDWANLIVGRKFTVYFEFEGNFQVQASEGLIHEGLIFGILRNSMGLHKLQLFRIGIF